VFAEPAPVIVATLTEATDALALYQGNLPTDL
jgi:hypothetical protein